jgi:hypothetical protein
MTLLEHLQPIGIREKIYRLANPPAHTEAFAQLEESATDIADTVTFQEKRGTGGMEVLLDSPFAVKPGDKPHATRFSDGSRRVFYAALERETCEMECAHWLRKKANTGPAPVHYSVLRCTLSGTAFDVRPMRTAWTFLTGEENAYPQCQALANEAVARSGDAMLCPSARRPEGTTTPVFARRALSEGEIVGKSILTLTNDGIVNVEHL